AGPLPNIPSAGCLKVGRFIEKPDFQTATRYLQEGYLWNSGNFMFSARSLLDDYGSSEPETIAAISMAVRKASVDLGFAHLAREDFAKAGKRSIDYAVMEKTQRAAVVPASFDWSDVGSWSAVRDLSPQDEAGNAAK